jgi:hypothetical protein
MRISVYSGQNFKHCGFQPMSSNERERPNAQKERLKQNDRDQRWQKLEGNPTVAKGDSKSERKLDAADQHRRFIETARELGCDENEAAFEEKLRRIATVKPKPKEQASTKRRGRKAD